MSQTTAFIEAGKRTVAIESQAVSALQTRIDQQFVKACEIILACQGRVIVTGMGKSGHIGGKMAATFASTGTPAFFVHPGEASHGDLGMVTKNDVVIAISNSGSSAEVLTLIPLFKRMQINIISMTGNPNSPLAQAADVNLDISIKEEACPLDLAPTSSTTVTLVMGDALAVALLEARGFTKEEFAFSHPGGALGRRLLIRASDLMHSGTELPKVSPDSLLSSALVEMTRTGFGMTTIVDSNDQLIGVFTDGDLRRNVDQGINLATATMAQVMNKKPKAIKASLLAAEALNVMEQRKITALVVEDDNNHPVGLLHMHDILRAGIV